MTDKAKPTKKKAATKKATQTSTIETANNGELVTSTSADILGKPYNFEWAIDGARQALADHNRSGIAFGLFIKVISDNEEHGNFIKAIEKIGVPKRTAFRYKARAEFVLENQDEFKCANLAHLSGSKIDLLLKLPEAVIGEIANEDGMIAGKGFSDIESMTAADFAELIGPYKVVAETTIEENKELKKEVAKVTTERDSAKMEATIAKNNNKAKPKQTIWPDDIQSIREESGVAGLAINSKLDDLETMMGRLLSPDLMLSPGAEGTKQMAAAAKVVFMQLAGTMSRAQMLINEYLENGWSEFMVNKPEDAPHLTLDEAKSMQLDWRVLMRSDELDKQHRAALREATKPAKRGRPKGSTAKATSDKA